jgi:hypothetical protein
MFEDGSMTSQARMNRTFTLTPAQARKLGFKSLTSSFDLSELPLLASTVATLRRGKVDIALVDEGDGLAVYRQQKKRASNP